jgi:hypothetical protein
MLVDYASALWSVCEARHMVSANMRCFLRKEESPGFSRFGTAHLNRRNLSHGTSQTNSSEHENLVRESRCDDINLQPSRRGASMKLEPGSQFESIESAHEFVALLADALAEAKRDITADVQREANSGFPRRLEALRITLYSLEKLEIHMNSSRRILNDLRTIRRLLFQERTAGAATAGPKAKRQDATAMPIPPSPSPQTAHPGSVSEAAAVV